MSLQVNCLGHQRTEQHVIEFLTVDRVLHLELILRELYDLLILIT